MPKARNEYAVYHGDTFLDLGTAEELAERMNVKADTIRYRTTPTYKRRSPDDSNRIVVIKIEEDEE